MEKLTEGERIVKRYLDEEIIFHEEQVEIKNLKGDPKKHRVADFYLDVLKVYVEFNGQWNLNKEARERYREKKRVYSNNNIPCVYLYPENLGILKYVFHERIIKVLKEHNLKRQLFRYRLGRYVRKFFNTFMTYILLPFFLFDVFIIEEAVFKKETEVLLSIGAFAYIILGMVKLALGIRKHFFLDK